MNPRPVIIAGTAKSGSTSLFRYLSAHPRVCGSVSKEPRYFLKNENLRGLYSDCFAEPGDAVCTLEATPQYLDAGDIVATQIKQTLPDAKLIFTLREPVSRLRSFFRSYQSRASELVGDLTFDEFAQQAIACDRMDHDSLDGNQIEYKRELRRGLYGEHLVHFLDVFPASSIRVVFFDDLSDHTYDVVTDLCRFIGVDKSFYHDYELLVENKTRTYRSAVVHKLGYKMNRALEPVMNRNRWLKKTLRKIYLTFNEQRQETPAETIPAVLRDYYAYGNQQFADILHREFPKLTLPHWVEAGLSK